MKKILTLLIVFFGIFITSCEDPTPDCELYGYGDVTVKNSTGYEIVVDVTYTSNGINNEKWLYNNGSYTYEMDEGTVYIWASFDDVDWVYDTYYLKACESLTYTWYLNKKKSTNNLELKVTNQFGETVKTINDFEITKR